MPGAAAAQSPARRLDACWLTLAAAAAAVASFLLWWALLGSDVEGGE
jgi:hypothetical protein